MPSDLELLKTFAPVVRLHPCDHHRPSSVDDFLENRAALYDREGAVIVDHPSPEQLIGNQREGCYLAWDQSLTMPTSGNDRNTGLPVKPVPDRPNEAYCEAPCYGRAVHEGDFIDLVYAFYYEFNSFQTFRARLAKSAFTSGKRNFEWANFARHQGDWEHVTVRVDTTASRVLGAWFTGHGKERFIPSFELEYADEDGKRVIVYSALNSHASYADPATKTLETIVPSQPFPPVFWLKAVDCTQYPDDSLVVYDTPDPLYSRVEWDTAGYMVDTRTDPRAQIWLEFAHPWGQIDLDNSAVQDAPSGLPGDNASALKDLANVAKILIPEKYLRSTGPKSPGPRGWFRNKEDAVQFIKTQSLGGPHGDEFDDADSLPTSSRISSITLTAGRRVDSLAVAYSNGYIAQHGDPKDLKSVDHHEFAKDERITWLGVATKKHDRKTQVGYIEIRTSKGVTIKGGGDYGAPVPIYDAASDGPFEAFAFFGRASDMLYRIGLVLKVGAGKTSSQSEREKLEPA